FGIGALIVESQPVFHTLRWLGVAYLCYLGVQALRSARKGDYATVDATGAQHTWFRRFREGFLTNVTNPKVLALYLSVLPQFIDPVHSTTEDTLLLAYRGGAGRAVAASPGRVRAHGAHLAATQK